MVSIPKETWHDLEEVLLEEMAVFWVSAAEFQVSGCRFFSVDSCKLNFLQDDHRVAWHTLLISLSIRVPDTSQNKPWNFQHWLEVTDKRNYIPNSCCEFQWLISITESPSSCKLQLN